MSATHFIFSAICIGVASTCIEWFIYGFLFHKYQMLTPQTFRAESNKSYVYSTLLSFLFGALFTLFYFKIGCRYSVHGDAWSNIKQGLMLFGCFSFITEINNAIYVNYDKNFVAGKLISSLLCCLAAVFIASFFIGDRGVVLWLVFKTIYLGWRLQIK